MQWFGRWVFGLLAVVLLPALIPEVGALARALAWVVVVGAWLACLWRAVVLWRSAGGL